MSLRRQLTPDGIAHSNADSHTHARHVFQRAKAREIEWIPEAVSSTSPAAEFKLKTGDIQIGKGLYFVGHGKKESGVEGCEFEKHLSAVNWERRWNYASMKRKDKVCTVRRKRTTPAVGEFVVNLSPWQMTFLNGELQRWEAAGIPPEQRKETLEAFLDPLRKTVVEEFAASTGWEVVGSYLHLDSNKVHVGVIHSRVTAENKLVGSPYLKTIGPWSCAQSRIASLGAADAADNRLKENLERFHTRHGKDTQPLDQKLHETLDQKFEELIGVMDSDASKRFEAAKEHYRQWKVKARRDAMTRSPSSQRIAWETVRLVTPLLPREVRIALSVARTVVQVFSILHSAVDALSSTSGGGSAPPPLNEPSIPKTL
jgi:hypothetical protein